MNEGRELIERLKLLNDTAKVTEALRRALDSLEQIATRDDVDPGWPRQEALVAIEAIEELTHPDRVAEALQDDVG